MQIKLTDEQKAQLEKRHKVERDKQVCDRIKAVLLCAENWALDKIGQALRLHHATVRRHLEDYLNEAKLKPANGGSDSKLSKAQARELITYLETETYFRVCDICQYVSERYGIDYTIAGMTSWLKQYKFVYKKPKKVPAKADEEKQKAFIQYYEELKAKTPATEPILFIDSVHPTMETRAASGWIRKGQEKQIATTASRTRLNITGAIHLQSMTVTHANYDTINALSLIDFFTQLKAVYPMAPKLHIILDQAGYHRSEEVSGFAENNNIMLHFLPAYSPNLNSIERLWKVMNERVRNNHCFQSAKEFRERIFGFFTDILPQISESLKFRINDNFHVITTSF
jgi:transposase